MRGGWGGDASPSVPLLAYDKKTNSMMKGGWGGPVMI